MHNLKAIFVAIVMFTLLIGNVHATHIMGGDLTYECIDPATRTFKISLSIYRDCNGVNLSTSDQEILYSSSSCNFDEQTISLSYDGFEEITPVCAQTVETSCNTSSSSAFPGVQKYSFSGNVSLPDNCVDWEFKWVSCCRNEQITNLIVQGDETGFTLYASLNNLDAPCNNSPIFTTRPVSFICAQEPFNFNNGSFDADGDLLAYQMAWPLDYDVDFNTSNPIPFVAPFTFDQPLDGDFSLNPVNGQIFINANNEQVYVSTLLVEEYRNGIKIGSVIRELQTLVLDNAFCGDVNIVGLRDVEGGTQIASDSIVVCPETELNFEVLFLANGGSDYALSSNADLVLENSTVTSQTNDTLQFNVSWTPTVSDIGFHSAVFKIEYCTLDDIKILQAFAINIIVETDTTKAGPDRLMCSSVDPIRIDATGGSNFTWSPTTGIVNSTDNGSTIWVLPNLGPGQQICYTVTSDLSTAFCDNTDDVCITRDDNAAYAFSTTDTSLCGGYLIVDDEVVTSSGTFYDTIPRQNQCDSIVEFNVNFTPFYQVEIDTFFCLGSSLNIPGFGTINNDGVYVQNLPTSSGGCDSLVVLTVISKTTVYYAEQVTMCVGDSFQLSNGEYVSTDSVVIDSFEIGTGCDSITTITLNFTDYPILDIETLSDTICNGDQTTLNANTNGSSVLWQTSQTSTSINVTVDSSQYYYAEASSANGCTTKDSIFIMAVPLPEIIDSVLLCNNANNLLSLGFTDFEYYWEYGITGNDFLVTDTMPSPISVTAVFGECSETTDISIYRDSTITIITALPNDTVYENTEVTLTTSNDDVYTVLWETNDYFYNVEDYEVNALIMETDSFQVITTSADGCMDTTTILIVAVEDVHIPTAFTPNNDYLNDYFSVIGDDFESYNLRIYNVWGELIFESFDPSIGWDGTYKGEPQEMEIYVYQVSSKFISVPLRNRSGSFLLMR